MQAFFLYDKLCFIKSYWCEMNEEDFAKSTFQDDTSITSK